MAVEVQSEIPSANKVSELVTLAALDVGSGATKLEVAQVDTSRQVSLSLKNPQIPRSWSTNSALICVKLFS
jgi:hypothetical protein